MSKTTVGLLENASVSDQVVRDLGANDFPSNEIRVLQEPLDMPVTEVMSIPHTDFQARLEMELKAIGATTPEANAYAQGVARGGVLVFATGSDKEVDSASEIMNRHGAIEVEELTGDAPNLAGVTRITVPFAHTDSQPTWAGPANLAAAPACLFGSSPTTVRWRGTLPRTLAALAETR